MFLFWYVNHYIFRRFVYAIFGVTIYKGKMGYCGNKLNYYVSKSEVKIKIKYIFKC